MTGSQNIKGMRRDGLGAQRRQLKKKINDEQDGQAARQDRITAVVNKMKVYRGLQVGVCIGSHFLSR